MTKTKKLTLITFMVTMGVVISVFEAKLIHLSVMPGSKIGLSNIVCLVALYLYGTKATLCVNVSRAVFVGLIFSNPSSLLYSLPAAIVSVACMSVFKKILKNKVSCIGISVIGAFFHNLTQVLVSVVMYKSINMIYYFSYLAILSVVMGIITGIAGELVINRLKKIG